MRGAAAVHGRRSRSSRSVRVSAGAYKGLLKGGGKCEGRGPAGARVHGRATDVRALTAWVCCGCAVWAVGWWVLRAVWVVCAVGRVRVA